MTNKQLYNLVFENFVQAKRELIREGYRKRHLDEVDFNEIFDQTKKRMLEEKLKSLQRENEMLKEKLYQKQIRKEAVVGPQGGKGSGGSRLLDKPFRKLGKFFGNPMDTLTDIAEQLGKNSDNYRYLLSFISDKTLDTDAKIAKAITFLDSARRKGLANDSLDRGIQAIGTGNQPEEGIFENFKRKGLSKNKRRRY
jgi:hypothetical protein